MASEEQRHLAEIIKGIHQELRLESKKVGADHAWKKHCEQEILLKTYATTMHRLATEYWDRNADDKSNVKAKSRVRWVENQCISYVCKGGNQSSFLKEVRLWELYKLSSDQCNNFSIEHMEDPLVKPKLLDVGSCYNPFAHLTNFDVTAIDIAPASSEVFYCDFLNVNIVGHQSVKSQTGSISKLPSSSFSVVVFSLLLEYLPSAEQRFRCCLKASQVLVPGGILCIVTPDSKHETANSQIMKEWRYALASIGLLRIYYEKLPHMHCMVYRKCIHPDLSQRWLSSRLKQDVRRGSSKICEQDQLIAIPQDFHTYIHEEETGLQESVRDSDDAVASMFECLPYI